MKEHWYSVLLDWNLWVPLDSRWSKEEVPQESGIYRVRRVGFEGIDYIGQTSGKSTDLRKRVGSLKGAYREQMPYRDPHTAAPGLWAYRHLSGCDFEVSVVPITGTTQWRKGMESLAISLYRQEYKCSPSINFGRMPKGYKMSSANNRKLIEKGMRFYGGPTDESLQNHLPGISPIDSLEGPPNSEIWCGHSWNAWIPIEDSKHRLVDEIGLYRIRGKDEESLLYVGEGSLQSRLSNHFKKRGKNSPQGEIFGSQALECSWVVNHDWSHNQRLELENDLIAAHLLTTQMVPSAQFIG